MSATANLPAPLDVDPETGEIIVAQPSAEVPPFDLEHTEHGKVPERVINELRNARATAKDYATAFSECVKAQADKYGIKAGALKRYVVALEEDKLEEVDAETDDLARLIGAGE